MGRDVGALGAHIVGRLVVHGKTVVVTRSDVGITEGKLAERARENAIVALTAVGDELLVDQIMHTGGQFGNGTGEKVAAVGGYSVAREVEAVVGSKQRLGIDVRVVLGTTQSDTLQHLSRGFALGIEDGCGMLVDERTLGVEQVDILLIGGHLFKLYPSNSCLTQSKPSAKMRSPSSGPPLLTMRPR